MTELVNTVQEEEEEMEQWQRTGATRGRGSLSVPSSQTDCSILILRLWTLPSLNPEPTPLEQDKDNLPRVIK